MTPGVLFAICSLACAGVNDVVFKKYAEGRGSYGAYVFGIGIAWTFLQALHFLFEGMSPAGDAVTLRFGLAVGLCLVSSNLLLLESLSVVAVSAGSTIYRLNTIGVVLLSVLLLGETLDALKAAGILVGIAGVFFLYEKGRRNRTVSVSVLPFFGLAVAASLMRAFYGVISKAGISAGADSPSMILITSVCWIFGGLLYAFSREGGCRLRGRDVLYSTVSGILIFAIVEFLMIALSEGRASVVVPVANLSFIIAIGISTALKMERLSLKKFLAMTLAVLSVTMLAFP